jgi:tellurite resistance protein TerC
MNYSFIAILVQLIFLECILSIDNAAVLGAMVSVLSDKDEIPWPKGLTAVGHALNKLMGKQRTGALRVGLIMAYVLRGAMLLAASFIIQHPWLKVIGALYLVRLAVEDLGATGNESDDDEEKSIKQRGFWMTVLVVNLMDMAFSIDNVVAAVSLSDKLWVVMAGVAIGILVMRFAAGIFSYIVQKEPVLVKAAYILVLNIGVELLVEQFGHVKIGDWLRFGISIATILLALAYDHFRFLRFFRPVLIWLSQGLTVVNKAITWVLAPLMGLFHLFSHLFKLLFKKKEPAAS